MGNPWIKFYPRDWRGDQALRAVSIAARGFWMECICIMHEAKPYGHLVLNGHPVEGDALARMTGTSVDEVSALLAELRQAGVLSVTSEGVVFSRRMTKDFARASKGRKSVQKRWGQAAENAQENGGPNRSPNRPPTHSPTTQKPELSEDIPLSPSGDSPPLPPDRPKKPDQRATRLPEDWLPSPEDAAYARKEGLTDGEVDREAAKFRDHWIAASGSSSRKHNWAAAWRTWVRRAVEYRGRAAGPDPRGGGAGRYASGGRQPDSVLAALAQTADFLGGQR